MSENEKNENSKESTGGIRYLQVAMMFLCACCIYIVRSSISVAILAMTDETRKNSTIIEIYDWDENIRGIILSSFYWGYTIMQIPAGILAKTFGGKPLLLSALIINGFLALATPSLAKLGGWIAVCAIRATMGLSQACFMPSSHTLLGRWAPVQERARMTTIAYAGIQIGTVLAMPMCGYLASTDLGWKLIFYATGTILLVVSTLWAIFTANSPDQHRMIKETEITYIEKSLNKNGKECPPIPWKMILKSRPVYATIFAHIGLNWCFTIILVETPTYLKQALDVDLTHGSTISAIPFMAQWVVASVCSLLSDYVYNKKILSLDATRKLFNSISYLSAGIGLIILSFLGKEYKIISIIILTVAGGALGASSCGFMVNHIDLSPNFGGVLFGMTNCVANLFGIFAPLSTGYILGDDSTDLSRWRIVFLISAGLIICSDIIFRVFATSDRQPWDDAQVNYEKGSIENTIQKNQSLSKIENVYLFPKNQDTK